MFWHYSALVDKSWRSARVSTQRQVSSHEEGAGVFDHIASSILSWPGWVCARKRMVKVHHVTCVVFLYHLGPFLYALADTAFRARPFLNETAFLHPSLDKADRRMSLHACVGPWNLSNTTTFPAFGATNHFTMWHLQATRGRTVHIYTDSMSTYFIGLKALPHGVRIQC